MSTQDTSAPHIVNIVTETTQAKPTKRQDGSNFAVGCGDLAAELCKILGFTTPGTIRSLDLKLDATDIVTIKVERIVTNHELADINDAIFKSMLETPLEPLPLDHHII